MDGIRYFDFISDIYRIHSDIDFIYFTQYNVNYNFFIYWFYVIFDIVDGMYLKKKLAGSVALFYNIQLWPSFDVAIKMCQHEID